MLDKRVKTGIFGDYVEIGVRFNRRPLTYVIGDMKIQCIFAAAGNYDVFNRTPKGCSVLTKLVLSLD